MPFTISIHSEIPLVDYKYSFSISFTQQEGRLRYLPIIVNSLCLMLFLTLWKICQNKKWNRKKFYFFCVGFMRFRVWLYVIFIMHKYEIIDVIDEGAYGIVWKALNKETNSLGTSKGSELRSRNSSKVTRMNSHEKPYSVKLKCWRCLRATT